MTALPAPEWIATPAALAKLTTELARYPRIAVDTESNSLHAYREQLCLIQFSTPEKDYLVDPLVFDVLSPLSVIFNNPEHEKVFHAAEYDLICLKRDFGLNVTHLFDTMQAARILGYKRVGLDSMLAEKLGIKLDKKYQKADWAERPLSKDMLSYARLDTHHLLDLRVCLENELKLRGRWELAQEEFTRLAHGNGSGRVEIPAWQRVKGIQKLTDRQLTILQELCAWRESKAQQMNRPVFRVIDDKRLVELALAAPETQDEMDALDLTAKQIYVYGNDILQAISRGKRAILVKRPQYVRPKQAYIDRYTILSEWRKSTCQKMGVESDVILPKGWMHAIADTNPKTIEELAELMPNSPWRLKEFGGEILQIVRTKKFPA
ncbi:MAG TPA: HRDC domain-containing protein [Anaerolineales bacterium]|nr:HRDC domain-containing protein [Anaerolineales bacterium]